MTPIPPIDLSDANLAYMHSLQPGEEVIECGVCCMKGAHGVVYRNAEGSICVRWDLPEGKMGTSVTWGTRRITDLSSDANGGTVPPGA